MLAEGGLPLALLLLLAVGFKILYQLDFQANNPLSKHPVSDELLYIQAAERIAGGELSSGEVFHTAPLYPYLLAPVFKAFASDPFAARLFQALIGAGSVLILYLAARFFFSRPWALCAAASMLLYYPFTFFEGKLLIATSAVFFLNLSVLLLLAQHRTPRFHMALAAGVLTGITSALRPNFIVLVPLFALWFLFAFRSRKAVLRCFLFLAGAAAPILPFTMHNFYAESDFVLLSDNGGINFHLGNNPSARGSFHNVDPTWADIETQHIMAKALAQEAEGKLLKPSEVSGFWFGKGLSFISDEPGRYLVLLFEKLKSFIENFEYSIIYSPPAEKELTRSLRLPFLPYCVFITGACLGLIALLLGRGCGKTKSGRPPRPPGFGWADWYPVLIVVLANLISVLLFFNYSRFRMTALPAMILLAVMGIKKLVYYHRSGLWGRTACCYCVICFMLCASIIPRGDLCLRQKAHGLATIGKAYSRNADFVSAEKYLTKALDVKQDMILILKERGMIRIRLRSFEEAMNDLEEAVRLAPGYAPCLSALAGFYARRTPYRDLDSSLKLINEAKGLPSANPAELADILATEGGIRMERHEFDEAAKAYESAYECLPGDEGSLFLAGLAHMEGGSTKKAEAAFREVLRLNPAHQGAAEGMKSLARLFHTLRREVP